MAEIRKLYVKAPLLVLKGGLALTILMIVLVSYYTVQQLHQLNQVGRDLYEHPLRVSNAARDLKFDFAQIRIHNLQIAGSASVADIEKLKREMEVYVADSDQQLAIISQSFLGDMRRVEDLKHELKDWAAFRNEIVVRAMNGSITPEDRAQLAEGTATYKKIAEITAYISAFASNKAAQLIAEADTKSANAIRHLAWLTTLLVLIMVAGAYYLFKTIQSYVNELQTYAQTDPLTGLLNRRQFHLLASYEFSKLAREPHDLSVMLLDIDHFKQINDRFGHVVGDVVLVSLAKTLREELRDADLLCRWGGEEIVLLLQGISESSAVEIAHRLNRKIASTPLVAAGAEVRFTVSIGVAAFSNHENVDRLIAHADIALYHVKNSGRNGALAYSTISEPVQGASLTQADSVSSD